MPDITPTGCCEPFDPTPFRDAELSWTDKLFVKDHVHSFLHVPLDMGRVVSRTMKLIEASGAGADEQLMLSEDRSAWGSDVYIEVAKPVPGAEMARLSGRFRTRVYDGPFRDAPRWIADMKGWLASLGESAENLYLGYTTCPSCARAYGHNYVVLFARVASTAERAA